MGCDIHMVLEKKHNGAWVGLHSFPYAATQNKPTDTYPLRLGSSWAVRSRNYELFADLAGVRGEGTMGNEPRGVPDDASHLTDMEVEEDGPDGHSHTYMLLSEAWPLFLIHTLPGEILEANRRQLGMGLFGLSGDDDPDDYRLIIWFDN